MHGFSLSSVLFYFMLIYFDLFYFHSIFSFLLVSNYATDSVLNSCEEITNIDFLIDLDFSVLNLINYDLVIIVCYIASKSNKILLIILPSIL